MILVCPAPGGGRTDGPDQAQTLHGAITEQNMSPEEIQEIAQDIADGQY
jgi:hypothetical protein